MNYVLMLQLLTEFFNGLNADEPFVFQLKSFSEEHILMSDRKSFERIAHLIYFDSVTVDLP